MRNYISSLNRLTTPQGTEKPQDGKEKSHLANLRNSSGLLTCASLLWGFLVSVSPAPPRFRSPVSVCASVFTGDAVIVERLDLSAEEAEELMSSSPVRSLGVAPVLPCWLASRALRARGGWRQTRATLGLSPSTGVYFFTYLSVVNVNSHVFRIRVYIYKHTYTYVRIYIFMCENYTAYLIKLEFPLVLPLHGFLKCVFVG